MPFVSSVPSRLLITLVHIYIGMFVKQSLCRLVRRLVSWSLWCLADRSLDRSFGLVNIKKGRCVYRVRTTFQTIFSRSSLWCNIAAVLLMYINFPSPITFLSLLSYGCLRQFNSQTETHFDTNVRRSTPILLATTGTDSKHQAASSKQPPATVPCPRGTHFVVGCCPFQPILAAWEKLPLKSVPLVRKAETRDSKIAPNDWNDWNDDKKLEEWACAGNSMDCNRLLFVRRPFVIGRVTVLSVASRNPLFAGIASH